MQPGVETEAGSSHGAAAAAALGDGDGVEEVLLPKMAAGEEENSCPLVT